MLTCTYRCFMISPTQADASNEEPSLALPGKYFREPEIERDNVSLANIIINPNTETVCIDF